MKKNITLLFYWMFLILLTALFFIGTAFVSWFFVFIIAVFGRTPALEKVEQGQLFIKTKVISKEEDFVVTDLQKCDAVDCRAYVYGATDIVLLERSSFDSQLFEDEVVVVQLGKPEKKILQKLPNNQGSISKKIFPVLDVQDAQASKYNSISFRSNLFFILTIFSIVVPPVIVSILVFRFMYKEIMPKKEAKKAKK